MFSGELKKSVILVKKQSIFTVGNFTKCSIQSLADLKGKSAAGDPCAEMKGEIGSRGPLRRNERGNWQQGTPAQKWDPAQK